MSVPSRELVRSALAGEAPERTPRQCWVLPWARLHHPDGVAELERRFPDDIVHAPPCLRETPPVQGEPYALGTYVDEWGCTFTNLEEGVIGEVKEPLLKEAADLESLRLPRELLTVDRDTVNRYCRSTDSYVLSAACPRPFERLQFIRGTANLFLDLAADAPGLTELIDTVHRFNLEELTRWADTEVDALMFMDDWGTQEGLLISPAIWRRLFKPLYKDYIDLAHASGKHAFMHSDGHILPILPDLIDLGLDALNSQLFCMGLENLRPFKGKLTFWGELDRQHLLPRAVPTDIHAAAAQIRENLATAGRFIAQCEFGPGARPENVLAWFVAWP